VSEPILKEVARILGSKKLGWSSEDVEDARRRIGKFTRYVSPTEVLDVIQGGPLL
jgi:hypothetical protein